MSILLLSDAHLAGPDDPTQRDLLAFLQAVPFDELVLVGDLFDVWLVPPGVVPTPAVPVIAALHGLAAGGRPVTWVGGNHDPAPALGELGIRCARSWRGRVGSQRLLAVHGDRGTDEGLPHRALQRALQSTRVARASRLLGSDRVWRLGRAFSQARRDQHDAGGLQRVLSRQAALARSLLGEADVVLMGHSHAPGELPLEGGLLVNLGDWLEHRTFARADANGVRLRRWTGREEVALEPGPPSRRPEHLRR